MSFVRWNATPKVIKFASLTALFALAMSAITPSAVQASAPGPSGNSVSVNPYIPNHEPTQDATWLAAKNAYRVR